MRGLRGFFPTTKLAAAKALSTSVGVLIFSVQTFAQDAAAPAAGTAAPGGPPAWMNFVPFIFLIVVMMFITSRQTANQKKKQEELITGLKRGDQVLTSGGMLGRIEGIADTFLTLEIADGVRVKILKSQIAGPANLEAKT